MISYSVEKEYQGMLDAYEKAGGGRSTLQPDAMDILLVTRAYRGQDYLIAS